MEKPPPPPIEAVGNEPEALGPAEGLVTASASSAKEQIVENSGLQTSLKLPTLDPLEAPTPLPPPFRTYDGIEVKISAIPNAGYGLYATQLFKKGATICEYTGNVLRTKEALRVTDKSYLMRLGPQVYVDARECLDVASRYINDCRNPAKHNVCFDKYPDSCKALVVSLRDISPGEELYVDYGRWYWLGSEKGTKLP
jgi:hypothetical protein